MTSAVLIAILIFIAVSGYVWEPVFSARRRGIQPTLHAGDPLENLSLKKDEILLSLKDLELDHELKKLSDDDFHQIYNETFQEGAEILRQIDVEKKREGAAIASQAPSSADGSVKPPKFCGECGEKLVATAKFCAQCGARVPL